MKIKGEKRNKRRKNERNKMNKIKRLFYFDHIEWSASSL